jgi:hypothetical protein
MARHGPTVTRSFSASAATRPSPHSAPVPPPPVATSRPTPQFTQHHDVAAPRVDDRSFRQGWRVATRLDSLLEAGRIDREAWDCACQWRRWAETITPHKAQLWDTRVDISTVPTDAGMLLRVHAASKLREAAQALGELRVRLLEACVLRDRSWREIAAVVRISDKTVRDYTVEAITALADWRCGRPVAPAPVLRYRIEPGRQ